MRLISSAGVAKDLIGRQGRRVCVALARGLHLSRLLSPSALAAFIVAGPVLAADVRSPVVSAVQAPSSATSWDGVFIGLNAGGSVGAGVASVAGIPLYNAAATRAIAKPSGAATGQAAIDRAAEASGYPARSGFIGGGQIGYARRLSPDVVTALEADIQGLANANAVSSFSGASPIAGHPANTIAVATSLSSRIDYLGTIRGRVGYLVAPAWLLYATGGLAYGGLKSSFQTDATVLGANSVSPNPDPTGASSTRIRAGFAIGGGAEWRVTQNWSVKAEYLYYDLGTAATNATLTLNAKVASPFIVDQIATRSRVDGHVARLGLNYTFSPSFSWLVARD